MASSKIEYHQKSDETQRGPFEKFFFFRKLRLEFFSIGTHHLGPISLSINFIWIPCPKAEILHVKKSWIRHCTLSLCSKLLHILSIFYLFSSLLVSAQMEGHCERESRVAYSTTHHTYSICEFCRIVDN
jgi:hypothetical protein